MRNLTVLAALAGLAVDASAQSRVRSTTAQPLSTPRNSGALTTIEHSGVLGGQAAADTPVYIGLAFHVARTSAGTGGPTATRAPQHPS